VTRPPYPTRVPSRKERTDQTPENLHRSSRRRSHRRGLHGRRLDAQSNRRQRPTLERHAPESRQVPPHLDAQADAGDSRSPLFRRVDLVGRTERAHAGEGLEMPTDLRCRRHSATCLVATETRPSRLLSASPASASTPKTASTSASSRWGPTRARGTAIPGLRSVSRDRPTPTSAIRARTGARGSASLGDRMTTETQEEQ
jgi:hypothetical protein